MTLRRCLPPFAGSAVLFLVFVVGCKPRQFSTIAENDVAISAEAERTAARLLQKHNPFVMPSAMPTHIPWNFGGWMVRQGGLEVSNVESRVFPQGHPATVLTQKMVHRIHAAAVASIPALRGIPEPMVTVLKDPEPNAFTSTGVICLPVPIVPDAPNAFSPEPAPEKEWITAFGGKLYPGEIGRMVGGVQGESCPAGVEARANLVPQLLQSLRLGSPECQPALKNGTLVISQQCYNSVALPGGARGVLHLAAAASIVVHAGLLAKFDERHVEAAVAHEMAHYYRNHVAKTLTSEQQVSYFFRIPDYQNRSAVPPRDDSPETKALANELGTTQSSVPFVISGLQNHPSAARLAKFICQNSKRAVAKTARDLPHEWANACAELEKRFAPVFAFPFSMNRGLRLISRKQYHALDAAAGAVFSAFSRGSLGETIVQFGSDELSRDIGRKAIIQSFSSLAFDTEGFVHTFQDNERLSSLVREFNERARRRDERVLALAARAADRGMAWYTSEVEADEIAAYLLSMADKNPKQLIDLFFRFAGVVDEDSAFAPSAEDCKKGFVNGWQHWVFRGKAWVPFLGSPNDTHPSQCFRAYNVDTEIFKQGIPLGRDTAPSEAWRLMQATLTNSPVSLD